tara:strand:- start:3022 stop:3450 length:429 start_codon:yes stop_codon:yes gene_type:complete
MKWNRFRFACLRKELGMTQTGAAKWLGVSQKTISFWETGKNKPTFATTHMMAHKISQKIDQDVAFNVTGIRLALRGMEPGRSRIRKVVIVEFEVGVEGMSSDGWQQTYAYETEGLIEHIAGNLTWIKSIQVMECKNSIEEKT